MVDLLFTTACDAVQFLAKVHDASLHSIFDGVVSLTLLDFFSAYQMAKVK
jgi:hypothetical protein